MWRWLIPAANKNGQDARRELSTVNEPPAVLPGGPFDTVPPAASH